MKRLLENESIETGNIYFSDINDSKVFISDFKGKPILLLRSTQKSAKESAQWGKALNSIYDSGSVTFLNVAFIEKEPPASIRTSIKNQLKRGYGKVPFVIDWSKSADLATSGHDDYTHIFLIDPQGYLRLEYAEKYSGNSLEELVELINKYV